ncbi:unnamed protein product [Prunus brigantina]
MDSAELVSGIIVLEQLNSKPPDANFPALLIKLKQEIDNITISIQTQMFHSC